MPRFDSKSSPLAIRQELSIANPDADDASSQASDESSLGIALDEAQKPVTPTVGYTGLLSNRSHQGRTTTIDKN